MSLVKKDQEPGKAVYIYLKDGKNHIWRVKQGAYWPVVDELSWIGVKRLEAESAAEWSRKANPGDTLAITVDVAEKKAVRQHVLILEAVEE